MFTLMFGIQIFVVYYVGNKKYSDNFPPSFELDALIIFKYSIYIKHVLAVLMTYTTNKLKMRILNWSFLVKT